MANIDTKLRKLIYEFLRAIEGKSAFEKLPIIEDLIQQTKDLFKEEIEKGGENP
ncbi:MAG: hypothetical protein CH104c_0482 [Candidatus Woesebacteria bacterium]|nr:MAG: hypothetical protein CH104c_0482 [Candidatus Woesebacteria bacterium]